MKAFRILGRNIRDSFKSVFRNFSLSLASISCIIITLIVVSISVIITVNVNSFANLVEEDVTIIVFLKSDINTTDTDYVESQIITIPHYGSHTYKSKTEITEDYINSSDVFKSIMSDWTEEENPLQSTFLVKVNDINYIGEVANKIKSISGVDTVKYGEGLVEQLVSTFDLIKKISIGVVIALVLVTAFLISNTIKITIFSRRREIEIMRLVGASNLNIKIPFIFEGLFLGIIGSIIPIIVTVYGYTYLYNKFGGKLYSSIIEFVKPEPFIYYTAIILLGIGILVGMFGSYRAVRKHLKI